MTIDRSRRITFEEAADLYDEACSGYPDALVDDVLRLSDIPSQGRILEIGCGPGNATLPFARRNYGITAIELGERLATLAKRHCRAYPRVEIHNVAFEEWEVEEEAFDLAISADAFHWIPREIGYPRVARALKDSGSAAFFWRAPVDPHTDWSQAIEDVYRARAPGVENPDRRFTVAWMIETIEDAFASSRCFGPVTVKQYTWSEACTSDRYIKMLRTYSGHRDVDEATRRHLYSGILEAIEQAGGTVTIPNRVVLFHAPLER